MITKQNEKPVVIFSSDDNLYYSGFAPVVEEFWGLLGFDTYYARVGSDTYPQIDKIPTSLQAQLLRLYASRRFKERIVLITDIDMLPFNKKYFWERLPKSEDEISIYSYDAHGGDRYPMCYLSAYGKVLSDITLEQVNESWPCFVKRMYSMNLGWNTDEIYITKKIKESSYKKNEYIRGWQNGLAFKRLDRACWSLNEEDYIDAHCPRPFSRYKDTILSLRKFINTDYR